MSKRKTPYRSKVKIGVDANGKDIVKYIQGYTREELRQARKAVIAQYITGEALASDRLFGDYASEWYRVKKAPFVSASSQQSYRTALNKHLFPPLGNQMMRSITSMQLQQLLNDFAGSSASKITVILATLRGVFASARADRLIDTDPTESLIRPSASKPKEKVAFTPDQRAKIADVCAFHPQGAYLALMYYLGVRPGEARGLRWGDIDWKAGRVHVERDIDYKDGCKPGELKTAASRRTVPLPAPLRAILAPLRGMPDTYIAHGEKGASNPLAKSSAERLWVELMKEAGLVEPAEDPGGYCSYDIRREWRATVTPHALRHNYITMCWESGLDPYETMKLVGHASITTTLNIYTHLSEVQLARTAEKLDNMFAGVPSSAPWTANSMQL